MKQRRARLELGSTYNAVHIIRIEKAVLKEGYFTRAKTGKRERVVRKQIADSMPLTGALNGQYKLNISPI